MQTTPRVPTALLILSLALGMSGCLERPGAAIGPEVGYGQDVSIGGSDVSAVDVMFVIDNSNSMRQEQTNLSLQIPRLVRDLASPPDNDGDGSPDWNAAELIRIGIVTTDVGTGDAAIAGSNCVPNGDDGALQGGIFEWREGDNADDLAAQVATTVAELGIVGCALEQPLEAAARAVGHRDATGFPADDHLFALVVVTDEEDCSVDDDTSFFTGVDSGLYNVHCARHRDAITPVDTLRERIQGSRSSDNFLFAAIAGIPLGIESGATPAEILDHPEMQHREELDDRGALIPSAACHATTSSGADLGDAQPARRLVEFGRDLAGSVTTTICTEDFGPAIGEIAARIGSKVRGVCLVRELPRLGGEAPCQVTATLPVGDRCENHPGYDTIRTNADGAAICDIAQVNDEQPSGFYYDAGHEECPQLVLTEDATLPRGGSLEAQCFAIIEREDGEQCARSSQCASRYCDPLIDACAPPPPPEGGGTVTP